MQITIDDSLYQELVDKVGKANISEYVQAVLRPNLFYIQQKTEKSSTIRVNNEAMNDDLAFNKALDAMPVLEGYDEVDIFARADSSARVINFSK